MKAIAKQLNRIHQVFISKNKNIKQLTNKKENKMQKQVPKYRLSLARREAIEGRTNIKQCMLFIGVLIVIATFLISLFVYKCKESDARMERYAESNNCTWHYTGTMYGDDRDLICK